MSLARLTSLSLFFLPQVLLACPTVEHPFSVNFLGSSTTSIASGYFRIDDEFFLFDSELNAWIRLHKDKSTLEITDDNATYRFDLKAGNGPDNHLKALAMFKAQLKAAQAEGLNLDSWAARSTVNLSKHPYSPINLRDKEGRLTAQCDPTSGVLKSINGDASPSVNVGYMDCTSVNEPTKSIRVRSSTKISDSGQGRGFQEVSYREDRKDKSNIAINHTRFVPKGSEASSTAMPVVNLSEGDVAWRTNGCSPAEALEAKDSKGTGIHVSEKI
jgi:hypothetical protein